ncbi:hypothetical protein [Mariniphaga sp.]|uniref:hypothetical protein n=1 Tax=Mariniphaga sp. TaxID=1954475 RepID=UPI00356869A3
MRISIVLSFFLFTVFAGTEQVKIIFDTYFRGGVGKYWEKVVNGFCVAKENNDNYWVESDKYNYAYLVLKKKPEEMARLIESIMLNQF